MTPVIDFVFYKEATEAAEPNSYIVNRGDSMTVSILNVGEATFTVVFQGRVDVETGDWINLAAIDLNDLKVVTSATQAGLYNLDISGLREVRANITEISGGGYVNIMGRVVSSAG